MSDIDCESLRQRASSVWVVQRFEWSFFIMVRSPLSRSWRGVTIVGVCIVVASAAFALMTDSKRDKAIAAAKKYGKVAVVNGHVYGVQLRNRQAVDEVLPLLKDIIDLAGLTISGVDLNTVDMEAIGGLTPLVDLSLSGCGLTDAELQPLRALTDVTRINLSNNPISDRGLQFLGGIRQLRKVDLRFTKIHGEGVEQLASLPKLQELWLTGTGIDDNTVSHCATLSKLEVLYIPETEVTADGLMQLVNMHWLTKLAFPDGVPRHDRQRFADAFIDARRKARDAGEDVPLHDRQPF